MSISFNKLPLENPKDLINWLQSAETYKKERDIHDGTIEQNRLYEVIRIPSKEKIHRHADLKKHVFTASDGGELHHLHPIAALLSSTVLKKGKIPDHTVRAHHMFSRIL